MTSLEGGRGRRVCEGTYFSTRSLLLFGSVAGVGRALSKVLVLLEGLDGVEQQKGTGSQPSAVQVTNEQPQRCFL